MKVGNSIRLRNGMDVVILEVYEGGAKVRGAGNVTFTILNEEVRRES